MIFSAILYWTCICCSPRSHRLDYQFHPFSLNSSWPNLTHHYLQATGLHLDASLSWTTTSISLYPKQANDCISETAEDSRRSNTPTTPLLYVSNSPSSGIRLPSLALFHHSRSIMPTGINPKTSSTYHLQWHPWHVISQRLICCQLKLTNRQDRLSRWFFSKTFANRILVTITFFRLLVTQTSVISTLRSFTSLLAQSHKPNSFNHF